MAATYGRIDFIDKLLNKGADIDAKDKVSAQPLLCGLTPRCTAAHILYHHTLAFATALPPTNPHARAGGPPPSHEPPTPSLTNL
jgi:hypothetical protein